MVGRTVFTLMLVGHLALLSTEAHAVPVVVTGGSIHMNTTTPVPFDDVFISLQGPGFSLTNNFLQDSFHFTGTPDPGHALLRAGTMVDFTGQASLGSPNDRLVFNGVSYRASGTIRVTTSQAVVAPVITDPFTLAGVIHGISLTGPETVDLTVSGSGLVAAQFRQFPAGPFELTSIRYEVNVEAMPEPGAWLLVGTGVAGLAGWRWMNRMIC
jgi:hypothetical protein